MEDIEKLLYETTKLCRVQVESMEMQQRWILKDEWIGRNMEIFW